ncbi:7-cyano-7-deazaguanine synthase [Zooshikella ganghwensis]|uniref:7-cyano-7-deazaguanine synthase n=1 Tax=Zooshikella ganghwensis TaxID=202772 RepID=A0A4P9VMP2_9GAMM|nr:7-cyano-7-deazaguanine synthase [Zooshikella ganghwensis]RDH44156.1 hypothetical protein B9G39_12245 [Zooshikella ganghwensis]
MAIYHVLWTGGWDSTFRLLDLLINKAAPVVPYYILNTDRTSTGIELSTMTRIKRAIQQQWPDATQRLSPTVFRAANDVESVGRLIESYDTILQSQYIGPQYEWLAKFAHQLNLHDLELSIHKDDKAHDVLLPYVIKQADEHGPYWVVNPELKSTPEYQLFHYFRFPLFELTKLEMAQQAQDSGFSDILEMTWFCHEPLANQQPCGTCNPCRYTIEEGLSRRIPWRGKLRYWGKRALTPLLSRS